jgi:hypothetical protein
MNTKYFTGLAIAASLLIAQPAFAAHKGGGRPAARPHAVTRIAAVHRAPRERIAAAHLRARPAAVAASRRVRLNRTSAIAASHSRYTAPAARSYAANRTVNRGARNSVAFGGSSYGNNNARSHGTYAFASHDGWSHDRDYNWHGHHYHWYDNAWFIIDPYPYGYGPNYGYGYYGDSQVSVQVQAALQQQGYYQGPVDGVVGPGTRAAIAAYQQDNGLRVTGTITHGLLYNLGIG